MTLTESPVTEGGPVGDHDVARLLVLIQADVDACAAEAGVPGVSLGLVSSAGASAVASYGDTNVDHPLAVTSNTIFQAGSVSKLFTTLAAMRMVEAGEITLDDPVRTWLPALRLADMDCAANVTVRHLLQHTGGWRGDYDLDTGRGDGALRRMLSVIESAPQLTPLGATFHYSNLGFVLLGHVMATAREESFENLVRELVIDPLGMGRTSFFLEDLAFQRLAAGHLFKDGSPFVSDWARPRSRGPNGGILSCVDDLLTFARFNLGDGTTTDGTRLLSEEAMRQMMTPSLTVRATGDAVCLGWMYNKWGDVDVLGHSGGTLGFRSRLTIVPSAGVGVVVLTNATRGDKVIQAAQRAMRAAVVGDTAGKPGPVTRREGVEGEYEGGLELRFAGDDLTARFGVGPEPVVCRVGELAPDCLEILSGPAQGMKLEPLRDEAGSVVWVRLGGRLRARIS